MKTNLTLRFFGTALLCMLIPMLSFAQFNFSGQYMSRGEYRHGYQTLSPSNQLAAFSIAQRARLAGEYSATKYKIFMSMQDIRTWGSVANAAIDNKGLLSVHEAYAELLFNKKLSFKAGRQVLSYDDDRIFGSLDWAMQGRRHDAAVLRFADSTFTFHLGAAYNANADLNKYYQYNVAGNYQSFQFIWANKLYKKTNTSFLLLNNGMVSAKDSLVYCSQTLGLRNEYKADKVSTIIYAYYQMGLDAAKKTLGAYDVSAELSYKATKEVQLTLGGELLSGTSQTDTAAAKKENHSFTPLYGTNHRFNGYMDYFYVGNHINSVGLLDGYFKTTITKKKVMVGLNLHYFAAAAPVRDKANKTAITEMEPYLGTEIDFTTSYQFTEGVAVQLGYSQMFGSNTMVALKGGQLAQSSNWAYAMLLVRPGKVKWPKTGLKM